MSPLLLEVNTRAWLHELGDGMTLDRVPGSVMDGWKALGITDVWLMGIWQIGPSNRILDLANPETTNNFSHHAPGWEESWVEGSPYAIQGHTVSQRVGGEAALRHFRDTLNAHGIRLWLDFISNHVGLDHPWLETHPGRFITVGDESHGGVARGGRVFAHGRDLYGNLWSDTVQLDYRVREVRRAMTGEAVQAARFCDGFRCDMAMLQLPRIFNELWSPLSPGSIMEEEFWPDTISAVHAENPRFKFLGEVYWDTESEMLERGFDFVYDKSLLDHLREHQPNRAQRHVISLPDERFRKSVRFLENHDERRISTFLTPAEHRAALLLVHSLPGLPMVHQGEEKGVAAHTPVQFGRWVPDQGNAALAEIYQQILGTLREICLRDGACERLLPASAWLGNESHRGFVVLGWARGHQRHLVVVNLSPHGAQCRVRLSWPELGDGSWHLRDLLGSETHLRSGRELQSPGLYLDVGPHAAQLFELIPHIE